LLDDFCFPDCCCLFLDDLVMFMYFRHAVSSLRGFHSYIPHIPRQLERATNIFIIK
jgi:hypothetical protein